MTKTALCASPVRVVAVCLALLGALMLSAGVLALTEATIDTDTTTALAKIASGLPLMVIGLTGISEPLIVNHDRAIWRWMILLTGAASLAAAGHDAGNYFLHGGGCLAIFFPLMFETIDAGKEKTSV